MMPIAHTTRPCLEQQFASISVLGPDIIGYKWRVDHQHIKCVEKIGGKFIWFVEVVEDEASVRFPLLIVLVSGK